MTTESDIENRKQDHIHINIEKDVSSGVSSGFEKIQFIHEALPELNLSEIDLSQRIFGKPLPVPILISSMTGGTEEGFRINLMLSEIAQNFGFAMGVGSQRAAIENPKIQYTFQIRKNAPDILLFSNLGAVQLNYGYTVDHCKRAIEMIGADGIFLHLNPLQEALQPGGDTNFSGLLNKIENVCKLIDAPVIIKEVGWGISEKTALRLIEVGVSGIDVAGAGGTSWSEVEHYRNNDVTQANIAASFRGWGIPTVDSIRFVRHVSPSIPLIASGGLKDGIDIAKSIALGANLGGIAGKFIRAASKSPVELENVANEIIGELRIAMFAVGAKNLVDLQNGKYIHDLESK